MQLNWNLVLDLLMLAMLGGTMAYAYVLNRNLDKLRVAKTEFESIVVKLTTSISQAEKGLRDIKLAAQEVGSNLETQIANGRGLSQELQFMVESADSLANRLMRAAETGGQGGAADAPRQTDAPKQPAGLFGNKKPSEAMPRSRAEAQLLDDLNRVAAARTQIAEKEAG